MSQARGQSVRPREQHLHPLPIAIMHWTNAVAMFIMIGSGWKIYNDDVIFGWLHFPEWLDARRVGAAWPAVAFFRHVDPGAQRHRLSSHTGCVTGRFRRMLFPIRLRELLNDIGDALRFRLAHDDLTHYNAVQKTALCRHHPGRHPDR